MTNNSPVEKMSTEKDSKISLEVSHAADVITSVTTTIFFEPRAQITVLLHINVIKGLKS